MTTTGTVILYQLETE